MEWIDYRNLPPLAGGYSDLFLDFIHDFSRVSQFYAHNFRGPESFASLADTISRRHLNRSVLSAALEEQNRMFGSSAKTFQNIELLRKSTTFAVVTGQQVSLMGGPLYTVFKTITTIKLAGQLKAMFPARDFVPVFWLEGEDHDFPEMNHTTLLDGENRAVRIEYLPGGLMPDRNLGPIGELRLDATIAQTLAKLEATLQKTEFSEGILKRLKECYMEGTTFNTGFTSWMNALFADQGLVFISANHPALKKILSPLFIREVTEFPKTSQIVINQSAELEKKYHAQIKAKSINLFMFHKGGRYLIEPRENDFSLKGTRHFLQPDELLKIATETPELLSTNVILRPIAQDILLPTVAYVAGPAEVAYHAQLKPVYEYLDVLQPVIFPRASGSFLEERLRRAMEKYGLTLSEFLDDVDKVTAKVVGQISEVKIDQIFGDAANRIHESLNELKYGLKEIDPTLLGALEGASSKIDINIGVLKEKAAAAQKRRNEVAVRQIEKAARGLLPEGSLQERNISILHYLNKYGPDLVVWLMAEMDINGFKHQALEL